ncbi:MAG: type I glyceraldehyde-3-phosphate dehydrogenase, partial [Chloroflexota bacterium]|nr:type I glyceraldehyde-3-phosphate dehydrogenase [Chloroflexota bacterium]
SIVEFIATVERPTATDEVNDALRAAAAGRMEGVLDVTDAPLVSMDLKGNTHSSIVDSQLTMVMGDDLVKVAAWYDNEWGYACRVADVTNLIATRMAAA